MFGEQNLILWDPLLFQEQFVNLWEQGIAKLVWGREGSCKYGLVISIHSGISLDVHPEVQARKQLRNPFSYKLFSFLPKILNNQNFTCNQKCLLFLVTCAVQDILFPPPMTKELFVCLFALMIKHLSYGDFLLWRLG